MASLLSLSSTSSSSLLRLRKTPNPNPRFHRSFSLTPSPLSSRPLPPLSASLLSPPPPLLSNSTRAACSCIISLFHSPPQTNTLFFARIRHGGAVSSPLVVLASAVAKWLDLYGLVLMLRVLLSWFPDLPWQRQPFSAIRDLCDPYLSLFRRIIPPVFGSLDLSPILAFAVLGFLSKTINGAVI